MSNDGARTATQAMTSPRTRLPEPQTPLDQPDHGIGAADPKRTPSQNACQEQGQSPKRLPLKLSQEYHPENTHAGSDAEDVPQVAFERGEALPLEIDLGLMAAFDKNRFEKKRESGFDEQLESLVRGIAQRVFDAYDVLEREKSANGPVIKLPSVDTELPRHRPLPSSKPLTKWAKFAQDRKIRSKRESKKVWDETTQTWKPRWGLHAKKPTDMEIGIHEVKPGEDPMRDYFAEEKAAKTERIASNLEKQERNKLQGLKRKRAAKSNLDWQIVASKKSTASMGVFDKPIKGDIPVGLGIGRKKFEPSSSSKDREIANLIVKKRDKSRVINPATALRQLPTERKRQIEMDAVMDGGRSATKKRRRR